MKKRHWREIEAQANTLLTLYKQELVKIGYAAPVMPPIPIQEICSIVRGLSVTGVIDLRYEGKKLAGMLDPGKKAIFFEARDILGRQNFDMAHELGHYELHWLPYQSAQLALPLSESTKFIDEAIPPYFRCTDEDMKLFTRPDNVKEVRQLSIDEIEYRSREVEANQFASLILMPKNMVEEWAERFRGKSKFLELMARQFEVSESAMDIRLKLLKIPGKDYQTPHPNNFFVNLPTPLPSSDEASTTVSEETPVIEFDNRYTLIVDPKARLRTLISQINTAERNYDNIHLDFSLLETSKPGSFGPIQVLDLVLFSDYILDRIMPKRTLSLDNLNLTVQSPSLSSPAVRHLGRLGLFKHFRLIFNELDLPSEPDTATGAYVLVPLSKIEPDCVTEKIACNSSVKFLEWTKPSTGLEKFADTIRQVIVILTQNLIMHSSPLPNAGRGYLVVQLDRVWRDNTVTGYQVIISLGDIGVGIQVSKTDSEAITEFLGGSSMSHLLRIVRNFNGYIQVDSGDTTLSSGTGSTTKREGVGRGRVPGLQVTVLMTQYL